MAPPCDGKIGSPVQIAQRPSGMSLQVQSAGDRQILAGNCQQVGQRRILHLGGGSEGGFIIEILAPPVDAMRLQLTGGVNHCLASGERRLLHGDEAGGVAAGGIQMVPGDGGDCSRRR